MPQIVDRVTTADGKVVVGYEPKLHRHVHASQHTLDIIRQGLWGVVNDPKGTAHAARLDGISVAGKTGTAQVRSKVSDHAWFAGYAPAEVPEVAIVVFVEHGGRGGQVAAPIAMEVLQGYNRLKVDRAAGLAGPASAPSSAPALQPGAGGPPPPDAAPAPWGTMPGTDGERIAP